MGLEQLHLEGMDKVQFSIALIQANQPYNEPYYLADSGGKDSQVLRRLTEMASTPFEAHHSPTPTEPPELIRFIRQTHPDTIFDKPHMPFWKAFQQKGYPRRQAKWCCEYIKESGGAGRTVLMGIRSSESQGRKHRCFINYNVKGRTRFDRGTTRNIILPILLWTDKDVWTFLKQENLPYCSLYDEGSSGPYKGDGKFKRLGCVMCPSARPDRRQWEKERFPNIAEAWRRAGAKYFATHPNPRRRWDTADEFFEWWLGDEKAPPLREIEQEEVM